MGLEFGKFPIRLRKILYYSLGPEEQRPWAKALTHGLPNLLDRMIYAVPTMIPGFLMLVVLYKWSDVAHERYLRKDPKQYENDQ